MGKRAPPPHAASSPRLRRLGSFGASARAALKAGARWSGFLTERVGAAPCADGVAPPARSRCDIRMTAPSASAAATRPAADPLTSRSFDMPAGAPAAAPAERPSLGGEGDGGGGGEPDGVGVGVSVTGSASVGDAA